MWQIQGTVAYRICEEIYILCKKYVILRKLRMYLSILVPQFYLFISKPNEETIVCLGQRERSTYIALAPTIGTM